MALVQFRQRLETEFAQRRQRNPRYSLRAFARDLVTDHATLSQILRGRRRLSARRVALFGHRLGLSRSTVVDASIEQHAEAILRLVRSGKYQPNSRWIATRTGIPVDGVNAALDRLIRHRQLAMESKKRWRALR
jgi:hypothetical protein